MVEGGIQVARGLALGEHSESSEGGGANEGLVAPDRDLIILPRSPAGRTFYLKIEKPGLSYYTDTNFRRVSTSEVTESFRDNHELLSRFLSATTEVFNDEQRLMTTAHFQGLKPEPAPAAIVGAHGLSQMIDRILPERFSLLSADVQGICAEAWICLAGEEVVSGLLARRYRSAILVELESEKARHQLYAAGCCSALLAVAGAAFGGSSNLQAICLNGYSKGRCEIAVELFRKDWLRMNPRLMYLIDPVIAMIALGAHISFDSHGRFMPVTPCKLGARRAIHI